MLAVVLACAVARAGEPLECRIVLLDGEIIAAPLVKITPERVLLEGRERPLVYHELREIRFGAAAAERPSGEGEAADPRARGFVRFSGGEVVPGRILRADDTTFTLLVRGARTDAEPAGESIGELVVPLRAVGAFRLREPHASDGVFEETLAGEPPATDLIFVRKGDQLLRVEGVFRALDEDSLTMEYGGEERRINRTRIMGVVLAPVAGTEVERGDEGSIVLHGGGRIPATLRGLAFRRERGADVPQLDVAVHGMAWRVDLRHIDHVAFASDRITFLSDLDPAKVREVSLLGGAFPYQRDRSVSGGPLRLAGEEYRKGLGVHSRSVLEYALESEYASFVARVGINDSVGARGKATVRVLGNGRTIWEGSVAGGEKPVDAVVSILGIKTLTLETDYGEDAVDLADHVDWVDARVVKPSSKAATGSDAEPGAETPAESASEPADQEPREP